MEFRNLANNLRFGSDNPDYRFFGGDRIASFNYRTTMNLAFRAELVTSTPEKVQLALIRDDFPGEPYLSFKKVYTIERNSAAVKVEYCYTNRAGAMAERVLAPHFRQAFFVNGAENVCTVPETMGSKQYSTLSGKDLFVEQVTRPFAGCSDGKGNGLAMEFDLAILDKLYIWRGGMNKSTLELFCRPVKIPAGGDFKSELSIFPYSGLSELTGAGNGIAAQLTAREVRIFAAEKIAGTVEVEAKFADRERIVFSKMLLLNAGESAVLPLNVPGLDQAKGLKLTLKRNNEVFFKAEKPLSPDCKLDVEVEKVAPASRPDAGYTPDFSVKTPHIPWAKNFIGGTPRILFITGSEHSRELVELAQRMDIELHTFWISLDKNEMKYGRAAMYGMYNYADANQELEKLLAARKYDAIVISSSLPRHLSAKNIVAITTQLAKGTGLLLITPEALPASLSKTAKLQISGKEKEFLRWEKTAEHPIVSGVSPELLQPGYCTSAKFAGGQTLLSSESGAPLLSISGCTVLMNTGSKGGLLPFLPYKYDIPEYDYYEYQFVPLIRTLFHISGKLPEKASKVSLVNGELAFEGGDSLQVFACNLTSCKKSEFTLQAGEKRKVSCEPGINAFCYIVRKQGRTVDFGTLTETVRPAGIVKNIILEKELFQKGDIISGKIAVEGTPGTVTVRLIDALGRELVHTSGAEFAFPLTEASSRRMYVTAELSSGGKLQSRLRLPIVVKAERKMAAYEIINSADTCALRNNRSFYRERMRRIKETFNVGTVRFWSWHPGRSGSYNDHLSYGFGMDFPMIRGEHLSGFFSKFAQPYARTGDKKYLYRNPCYHEKQYFDKVVGNMKERFSNLEKFTPVSYDFADESGLTLWENSYDFCFAPATLNAFREALKKRYGSLDKLNAEWGSDFSAWENVEPMTTPEMRKKLKKSRNYAAWAEFRDFMDETFSSWHRKVSEEARKCGITVPFDISGTFPDNAYNGLQWYRWAPFIDQASLYHGNNQEELMRSFAKKGFRATPWFGYGNAGKGVFYQIWHDAMLFRRGGASYYSTRSIMRPDYTLDRPAKDFEEATRDLRNGVGELLNIAENPVPDVLIHFSQASIFAAAAEERLPEFFGIRKGWVKLLNDSKLTFRFIAYADIEKGALMNQPCRTLILPDSIAMSAKEAEEIRKFAMAGGRVIASGNTAIMNEKCRLLPSGHALGKCPTVFRMENPGNYPFSPRTEAIRRKIAPALPAPALKISGEFGACRVFPGNFRNGGKLIGIVRESEVRGESRLEIALPGKHYWYDVRKFKLLSHSDKQKVNLKPGEAVLLAAYKEKLPAPELKVTAGEEVKWQVALPGNNSSTVFNVEVFSPDGKRYELYSKLAPAVEGRAVGGFRPALNDPAGVWKIRCTDRVSGEKTEKTFEIKRHI